MTILTTQTNALALTIRDEDHPITLRSEVKLPSGEVVTKEYLIIKTKSGAIAVMSK